eukprot:scaffold7799_cov363-Prasinococcus_capsulatus_cf.AAC.3
MTDYAPPPASTAPQEAGRAAVLTCRAGRGRRRSTGAGTRACSRPSRAPGSSGRPAARDAAATPALGRPPPAPAPRARVLRRQEDRRA